MFLLVPVIPGHPLKKTLCGTFRVMADCFLDKLYCILLSVQMKSQFKGIVRNGCHS